MIPTDTIMSTFELLLDHTTDIAAIGTLAYLAMNGHLSGVLVGAITTVAVGKRYYQAKRATGTS